MSTRNVGDIGPKVEYPPVSLADIVRYAGASNDFNPIHYDEEYARASGAPSVFAQGMLSAGLLASFLVGWLGSGCVRRYSVRFRERVWPGDRLTASGRITAVYDENGERRGEVELALVRQNGESVITGVATVTLQQNER